MASGPETVIISTTLEGGGASVLGTNDLLLIAPHVQSGLLVSPNVVKRVRSPQSASTFFGDSSLLHEGAKVALQNISRVYLVGAEETTDTETVGDSTVESEGTITNTPITSITTASIDGVAYDLITYTHEDPSTLSPVTGGGTEEIIINMDTGAFHSGKDTTGAAAGIIIDYVYHDWASALEAAESVAYEVVAIAGSAYDAENYGIWQEVLGEATTRNKVVRAALASGAAPADVSDLVTSVRNGRLALLAGYYTGDLTSAWAAYRASRAVNSTAIRQTAPTGISYTDAYTLTDYGAEVDPSAGTFHEMGVNALFKDFGSTYRISSYRASTGLTDAERFADTRRVIRSLEVQLDSALNGAREKSDVGIPVNAAGISVVKNIMTGILASSQSAGLISAFYITTPEESDITDTERSQRLLNGFDVRVVLAPQTHAISLQLAAEV